VVVGLVRSHDPESYAGGRASHARQGKGDDPDRKGYPGPGWGFGVGLTTPPSKKKLIVTEVEQRKKLGRLNDDGRKKTGYTEIRELVADRKKQKDIVRQAKAHSGL